MGDPLNLLFQEWHRLGGAVLVIGGDRAASARSPEEVIAESTAYCRESGRLTWVVLDWLIHHVEQIDEQKLLQETGKRGDLSVLGVLCDATRLRNPHPKWDRIITACVPHDKVEPFFHRLARSPLASRLAREHALDVFRRWNYLCRELRSLDRSPITNHGAGRKGGGRVWPGPSA